MNVIVCLDNKNGMLFNNRRQSRDKVLVEKAKELSSRTKLWIAEFSSDLFDSDVVIDNDMLSKAKSDDFCFVENLKLERCVNSIGKIYVFKWNRDYPSDFKLDIEIKNFFRLVEQEEFTGNSHEKITMEIWEK